MDISGRRTAAPRRRADRRHPSRWLAAAGCALGVLAGCASGPTELGRPLPVERLSQLAPGTSTMAEVLGTLGEPQGRGAMRLPTVPVHELLMYESDTMDGTRMRMRMLIVFVNRSTGVYEGYMWFHSGLVVSSAR